MTRYAFFDVDNTIFNGYTASDLFQYLVRKKKAPPHIEKKYKESVRKYKDGSMNYATLAQKSLNLCAQSVAGKTKEEVRGDIHELLRDKEFLFFDWVNPVLHHMRSNEFSIILVSAGPDILINELASRLEVGTVFSTELFIRDGIYTDTAPKLLNDIRKVTAIRSTIDPSDTSFSVGFGDSAGDIPMLEVMDHAFVFENDHHPDMMVLTKEKGWTLFKNAGTVIETIDRLISSL